MIAKWTLMRRVRQLKRAFVFCDFLYYSVKKTIRRRQVKTSYNDVYILEIFKLTLSYKQHLDPRFIITLYGLDHKQ